MPQGSSPPIWTAIIRRGVFLTPKMLSSSLTLMGYPPTIEWGLSRHYTHGHRCAQYPSLFTQVNSRAFAQPMTYLCAFGTCLALSLIRRGGMLDGTLFGWYMVYSYGG